MSISFNNSYASLPSAFFERVTPARTSQPELIRINHGLAKELGVSAEWLESPEGMNVLSGNEVPPGADPVAMAYSGHQFGNLVPQLGDGRALLLGEVIGTDGIRRDIHLKGSGPTPFSRRGDGRSALGPVLREYIVSEAMAALGVPTTRALAAVSSGDKVRRETILPGGVFTRIAKSHIRVGTFQWFAIREDLVNLRVLADYVIDRLYPESREADNPYLSLLDQVIGRQASLMAHWMSLGFIHGVMNTDNMNISGETIDYGPCAFMDTFHPGQKFSSIDHGGRYAYGNQASIALWNLTRFAETLLPLIDANQDEAIERANNVLSTFGDRFQAHLCERFCAKIGSATPSDDRWEQVQSLLTIMTNGNADFTLVFRHLPDALDSSNEQAFIALFQGQQEISRWLATWRQQVEDSGREQAIETMRQVNPIVIPRNHRIEQAIEAANLGDFAPFHRLVDVLERPFTSSPDSLSYEQAPKPEEVVHATFCGT